MMFKSVVLSSKEVLPKLESVTTHLHPMHVYFLKMLGNLVKRAATNKMHDFTVGTDTVFVSFFFVQE